MLHPWSTVRSAVFTSLAATLMLSTGLPGAAVQSPSLTREATILPDNYQLAVAEPTPVAIRQWQEMTEAEQLAFVEAQTLSISAQLGDSPFSPGPEAIKAIRDNVDEYAERAGVSLKRSGVEGLSDVLTRAARYAPMISRAFREHNVPVIIGLYLPMIESEYRLCLESPYGARGIFQFMPASARFYGVAPDELCNPVKMVPAAARYIADRVNEFGSDARSMTLVLLSFNRSPAAVRRDLTQLRRANPDLDRSFWSLFANSNKLDSYFRQESRNYVPRFFAAAIVGENPEAFGLKIEPLSAHGVGETTTKN